MVKAAKIAHLPPSVEIDRRLQQQNGVQNALSSAMERSMSKTCLSKSDGFPVLLKEIKSRIQQAQTRAMFSVNAELIQLYWDIGRIIAGRQQREGWGPPSFPGFRVN